MSTRPPDKLRTFLVAICFLGSLLVQWEFNEVMDGPSWIFTIAVMVFSIFLIFVEYDRWWNYTRRGH